MTARLLYTILLTASVIGIHAQTTDATFLVKKNNTAVVDTSTLNGIYVSGLVEIGPSKIFKLYLQLHQNATYELYIGGQDELRSTATTINKSIQMYHSGIYKIENDTITFAYKTVLETDFTVINRQLSIPAGTLVLCKGAIDNGTIHLTRIITVPGYPRLELNIDMVRKWVADY